MRACTLACLLLGFPYPKAVSESKEVPYWRMKLGQQGGAQPAQVLPSGSPGGQALHGHFTGRWGTEKLEELPKVPQLLRVHLWSQSPQFAVAL